MDGSFFVFVCFVFGVRETTLSGIKVNSEARSVEFGIS